MKYIKNKDIFIQRRNQNNNGFDEYPLEVAANAVLTTDINSDPHFTSMLDLKVTAVMSSSVSASWASGSISSSYALSASWAPSTPSDYAISSSWASQSLFSSRASSSNYSISSSWASSSISSSHAINAKLPYVDVDDGTDFQPIVFSQFDDVFPGYVDLHISSRGMYQPSTNTMRVTASWAETASVSIITNVTHSVLSSSYASQSFYAVSASWASQSLYSISSSWASRSFSSSYAGIAASLVPTNDYTAHVLTITAVQALNGSTVNVDGSQLLDQSAQSTLDWQNRQLIANNGITVVASWVTGPNLLTTASNAISASYAPSSPSPLSDYAISASWASSSLSASYISSSAIFDKTIYNLTASNAISSSYALTASYAVNGGGTLPNTQPLISSSVMTQSIDFNVPYLEITGSDSITSQTDLWFSCSINRQVVSNAVIYVSASFDRMLYWNSDWKYLTISPPTNMTQYETLIASFTCFGPNENDIIVAAALTV